MVLIETDAVASGVFSIARREESSRLQDRMETRIRAADLAWRIQVVHQQG